MKAILINGEDSGINSSGLATVADLIELIKSTIDPDHMITSLMLDGKELDDGDWTASTNKYPTSVLEVQTNIPAIFVTERMALCPGVVQACFLNFRDARKSFQDGQMQEGNKKLAQAVAGLKAFFEWYSSLLALLPEEERKSYNMDEKVNILMTTCKKICQQQLYQSWWAIGETIKTDLEPGLDQLEDFCRAMVKSH